MCSFNGHGAVDRDGAGFTVSDRRIGGIIFGAQYFFLSDNVPSNSSFSENHLFAAYGKNLPSDI